MSNRFHYSDEKSLFFFLVHIFTKEKKSGKMILLTIIANIGKSN
jgi:hypothetical protein